ncbi:A disintegrin and metalloproteinase with thrombospondin motifs 16 [Elysia marginata]|uniref:A disintegrin and metalloproteinase with thrombospondin motifs 16 n=1 Tax=Elysia marginata TaxID=1093978 RepID=A0AAV4F3M8_9GAST|nr:A disintegrin and metalloproteinase with thrombospondin motifs 16 [Elysia marginata]
MMSPASYPQTDSNLLHPWQFSTCSSTAINVYIKSLERDTSALENCLLAQYGQTVTSQLLLTAQAVCEMYYGNTSFPCRNVQSFDEICTKLRCRTTEDANCILVIPPTGTCCGTAKTCEAGTCVDGAVGTCATDGKKLKLEDRR